MSSPGLAPRLAAVQLLDAVLEEGQLLSDLLPKAVEHLAPDERARAGRLAATTLRWMDRADRILGPYLNKRPPLTVLNTLRLATIELCVEGAAAHGVVNSSVEVVRAGKHTHRLSGLVNAVLRKVAAEGPEKWETLPAPQLPKWLRKPLIADFGKPIVVAMEQAHARGAPLDLTVKSDPKGWADKLNGTVLDTGSVRLAGSAQVSALEGFEAGEWWVQDAAAALPAKLLNAKNGERVLDICAAPGGKTMQLAAAGADVTSLDISAPRMERVAQNLERTSLKANIVVADILDYDDKHYDAILLDAPCTATGTIRRHPDLPYAKNSDGFPALFKVQERMLDRALKLLKPGGRLVFCTCSLLFDEGEEQVKDLLARHAGLRVDRAAGGIAKLPRSWAVEGGIRTRPDYWADQGGMDGFFMTVLRKRA